jgi:hypothetical protein
MANVKSILPKLIIFYMQISEQNNNLQLIWMSTWGQYNYLPLLRMSPLQMPTLEMELHICPTRCTLLTFLPLWLMWCTSVTPAGIWMWKDQNAPDLSPLEISLHGLHHWHVGPTWQGHLQPPCISSPPSSPVRAAAPRRSSRGLRPQLPLVGARRGADGISPATVAPPGKARRAAVVSLWSKALALHSSPWGGARWRAADTGPIAARQTTAAAPLGAAHWAAAVGPLGRSTLGPPPLPPHPTPPPPRGEAR